MVPVGRRHGARESVASAPRTAPPIRARDTGEILDLALDVYVRRFWFCAGSSALLSLIANALRAPRAVDDLLPSGLISTFAVQHLTGALVVVVVYGELQGRRIAAHTAIASAARRLPALVVFAVWPLLGALLFLVALSGCLVIAGPLLVALMIAGAWLLSLAPAAIVLEDVGPLEGMRRSMGLTVGALRVWLVLGFLGTWLVAPFATLPAVLDDESGRARIEALVPLSRPAADAFWLVVGSLFEGVATAFWVVVLAVWYVDRRVRVEGFDLVMRLERIEAKHAPGAA